MCKGIQKARIPKMHFRQQIQITFEEHEGNSQLRIIIGAFATVVGCLLCKVAVCPLCVHLKDVIMHLKNELIFCSTMTYFPLFKSFFFQVFVFYSVSFNFSASKAQNCHKAPGISTLSSLGVQGSKPTACS